ncbi:MAG: hypothetical protein AAFN11_05655 [Chloroflexota bacterium]
MLLTFLRYRYTKARMSAYVNGECTPETRRFIARQIDSDPCCYDEYMRVREIKAQLEAEMPRLGRPEDAQLSAIWANIQSEMVQPAPEPVLQARIRLRPRYSLGYSVAMLLLAIIMLTPFAYDGQKSAPSGIAQQPMPEATAAVMTPSADSTTEASAIVVAAQTDPSETRTRPPQFNTPAPRTPPQS